MKQTERSGRRFSFRRVNWKEAAPFLCAFLIPILIMIGIFIERGIFPFGDRSFLRTDMYHQYAPFFNEFKSKLSDHTSLLYTFQIGGGINFTALYAYYLASPLNWLLILCPQGLVIEFMTYMIVLKIGLCGLTFAYYLSRRQKTKNISIAFFGIFYALSGYLAAYSWNIMWLDCILLFPLIMLGLDRLIEEDKPFLYCITLGLSILSNYYISIMICISLVLLFVAKIVLLPPRQRKMVTLEDGTQAERLVHTNYLRKLLSFGLYSLLAGGLAACVLLPEICALQLTASGNFSFPSTFTSYFSVFDMIARHMVNVEVHLGLDHWPNIYCGVAVLFLIPLYIMNKKYSWKEKAVFFVLILFFYLSFSLNVLNFIWHGFHYPNSLPCRQSFVYIFLVLLMAYRGLEGIRERSLKQIVGAVWIALGFIFLAEKLITQDDFKWHVYYLSAILVAIYGLLAYLWRRGSLQKATLIILCMTLVAVEAAVNTSVTSVTTVSRSGYLQYDQSVEELMEIAYSEQGDNFFRVAKQDRRTKNDGAWMGYPSISLFSSVAQAGMTTYFKKLGLEGSTNSYSYSGATPFMWSLFAVDYVLSNTELDTDDSFLKFVDSRGSLTEKNSATVYLYENQYPLSVGFMIPGNLNELWTGSSSIPQENQNELIQAITGVSNVFMPVSNVTSQGKTSYITPDVDGRVFIYTQNSAKKISVSHDGFSKDYNDIDRGFLADAGFCKAGEMITLTNKDENATSVSASAYVLNEDAYARAYEKLADNQLKVTEYRDGYVAGQVTAEGTDTMLLTSIPYEKDCWTAKVDGVEVPVETFADMMISLPLTPGTHTIELIYYPNGLNIGLVITGVSLLLLFALYALRRLLDNYRKDHPRIWHDEEDTEEGSQESLDSAGDTSAAPLPASSGPEPETVPEELPEDSGAVFMIENEADTAMEEEQDTAPEQEYTIEKDNPSPFFPDEEDSDVVIETLVLDEDDQTDKQEGEI